MMAIQKLECGVGKSTGGQLVGSLNGVLDASGDHFKSIKRIVVLGASIMNSAFPGNSLSVPSAAATALIRAEGYDIDIYGYATPGDKVADTVVRMQDAFAAWPDDGTTLFLVHTMGNDISATRPYSTMTPTELANLNDDLDELFKLISTRANYFFVASATFRSYADPATSTEIFNDQSLGSKPYNDNLMIPSILATTPHAINSDGQPIFDFYNFTRNDYRTLLSPDGIHLNGSGYVTFREWIVDRLMTILPLIRHPVITPDLPEIWTVNFTDDADEATPFGVNFWDTGSLLTQKTLYRDGGLGTSPTITHQFTFPGATPPIGVSGIGFTGSGVTSGIPAEYAGDILCADFTRHSVYLNATESMFHTFGGLAANAQYTIEFVGSRDAVDVRTTRLTGDNFEEINTSSNPPVKSGIVTFTTDGSGVGQVTQTSQAGGFSYISGFRIERV